MICSPDGVLTTMGVLQVEPVGRLVSQTVRPVRPSRANSFDLPASAEP